MTSPFFSPGDIIRGEDLSWVTFYPSVRINREKSRLIGYLSPVEFSVSKGEAIVLAVAHDADRGDDIFYVLFSHSHEPAWFRGIIAGSWSKVSAHDGR